MRRKNAKYNIKSIAVNIICHNCNHRFESPNRNLIWERNDIGQILHQEMTCPNCQVTNKLPEQLINIAAGIK